MCGGPNTSITLVIFRGGGRGFGSPDPHLSQESRKSVETIDIRLFDKDCKLISLIVFMLCSRQIQVQQRAITSAKEICGSCTQYLSSSRSIYH